MSARATITLTDATPVTPVNRAYLPQTGDGKIFTWADSTQGVWAGKNKLSLLQRPVSKAARSTKLNWKLECPVLEQIAVYGPYQLAYTNIGTIDLVFHERATSQERKDMLYQLRDLIDESIVTDQVVDLNLIF